VRQSAGRRTEAQIVAANIDLVVVVTALDHDFNVRRLERWAQVVEGSGALPVVLLNKADLCADPAPLAEAAERAVPGARVIVASAASSQGLSPLREAIRPGITAALVGSSGVGKSTTVNALLGSEVQATREVRDHDHRGRHATTHRELFLLPGGGMLVDTPGLRELAAWADEDVGLGRSFSQVDDLIDRCRFRDCTHRDEPGCAVLAALDEDRLRNYHKLLRESRRDTLSALDRQKQVAEWKARGRASRERMRDKRGG
jgi:ribosome biogenesis GTPase